MAESEKIQKIRRFEGRQTASVELELAFQSPVTMLLLLIYYFKHPLCDIAAVGVLLVTDALCTGTFIL